MKTRLNKYLADRGLCSRREADRIIAAGEVMVNGQPAGLGVQVDETDEVRFKGELVVAEQPKQVFLAFHKPVGIITSVDPNTRDNVLSFLGLKEHIFPIGRLDVASSGLLLLTNDGRLSERVTQPKYEHEKEYVVTVDKDIDDAALQEMRDGMMILGSMTKPAKVTRVPGRTRSFNIILTEGRNRQIRRMCEALGYRVIKLVRIRVMHILLGDLAEGATRPLTQSEIDQLLLSTRD